MIKFHCSGCQKKIGVPENYAGKMVRCPQCKEPAKVPVPAPPAQVAQPVAAASQENELIWTDDLLKGAAQGAAVAAMTSSQAVTHGMFQAGGNTCPTCGRPCANDAVLCVTCGYNFKSGHQVRLQLEKPAAVKGQKASGISRPVKIIAGIVIALIAGIGGYALLSSGIISSLNVVGVVIGIVLILTGRLWFLKVACEEGTLWGLGCFFVDIVALIFFLTHISDTWKPTLMWGLGLIIIFVSFSGMDDSAAQNTMALNEVKIAQCIQNDDYMFDVACWVVEQQGRWDQYNDKTDGEFANLLAFYHNNAEKPAAEWAAIVNQEIQYVDSLVASWTPQQRREHVIAYNENLDNLDQY